MTLATFAEPFRVVPPKSMRLEKIHRACTCFFVALCCTTLLFEFATAARAETALRPSF